MYKGIVCSLLCLMPFISIHSLDSTDKNDTAASPYVVNPQGKEILIEGIVVVEGAVKAKDAKRDYGVSIHLEKDGEAILKRSLEPFLNYPLSESSLQQIKATILDYFYSVKHEYVIVLIPVQEVSDGVVVFQLLYGKAGEILYRGQKWFSEGVLKRSLGLETGDPLNEVYLLNYLSWLNRNPFRSTQMILSPGSQKESTDIQFITKDRFPARFYAGSDNTGFQTNGKIRVYGGFNWGNALWLGDLLSYQYTASPDFHRFQSHVVTYASYLSWKHLFTAYASYGQMFPKIPDFNLEGKNVQGSLRYQVPIKPLYGGFRSSVEMGFDYKYLNSNLFFLGDAAEALSSKDSLNITQLLLNYSMQNNWVSDVLCCKAEIVISPWKGLFPHQSESAYEALREGSHVRYGYAKASITNQYQIESGWLLSTQVRAQAALATLPTSEEFGLGGADTVRGYFEQQFSADNGVCINLELYTPKISLFRGVKNRLSFLAFVDYGYGKNYKALSSQFIHQTLVGTGGGVRYDIVPYLSLRADYGVQLKVIPGDSRFGRLHFSAVASY